jgi:hypothetical protein
MARTPSGTVQSVATVFGSAKTVTIVTNAAEAVVTSVAHGLTAGTVVEVTSGWTRLHKRAFRIKTVTTDTFVLEGADTSNVTLFTPGAGIGSVRAVTTWVQLSRTLNPSSSGGEAKKVTYKYNESDIEGSINDGFTAVDRAFDIDADEISSPGYLALRALTDVQSDTISRKVAKSGATTYLPCTINLNEEEIETDGQIVVCRVTVSGNSKSTRYAS